MLRNSEIIPGEYHVTESESDYKIAQSKKLRKYARKKKEGTEGIDALDEREDSDRWEDAADFYREEIC